MDCTHLQRFGSAPNRQLAAFFKEYELVAKKFNGSSADVRYKNDLDDPRAQQALGRYVGQLIGIEFIGFDPNSQKTLLRTVFRVTVAH